jgi:hypothetical protein
LVMTTVTIRSARLSWVPPSTNLDGSTLTDLAGFRIRWGRSSGTYELSASVADSRATSFETQIEPGTWYFVVSAVNSTGGESAPSSEASRTVN